MVVLVIPFHMPFGREDGSTGFRLHLVDRDKCRQ